MSAYIRRRIAHKIMKNMTSFLNISMPVSKEERFIKDILQSIRLRSVEFVYKKHTFRKNFPQYKLIVTNPDILNDLRASLPKNGRLQTKNDSSDKLDTWFELIRCTSRGSDIPLDHWLIKLNTYELEKMVLNKILKDGKNYGYNSQSKEENKLTGYCECPSTGYFHICDLYRAIRTNVGANILKAAGYKVVHCQYFGDASFPFVCLYQGLKENESFGHLNKTNLVGHFYNTHQQYIQDCQLSEEKEKMTMLVVNKIKNGDENVMVDVKRLRDVVIEKNKKIFKRFGIVFTHTTYQSEHQLNDRIVALLAQTHGKDFLFVARQIVALENNYEKHKFDEMIHTGMATFGNYDVDQILQWRDSWKSNSQFLNFLHEGKIRIRRISSPFLKMYDLDNKSIEDVINSMKQRVMNLLKSKRHSENIHNIEEVAEVIVSTCFIIQTISFSKHKTFDFLKSTKDGMFLQFVYARLCQILRMKKSVMNITDLAEATDNLVKCLDDKDAQRLILCLGYYEDRFEAALHYSRPNFIVDYLLDLASCVNDCLNTLKVEGHPEEIVQARLLLFKCAKIVYLNVFRLLGIKPLDKI